jgi:tetratricopeptide (TPR) repeat protein
MESGKLLDPPRRSGRGRLIFLLLCSLLFSALPGRAQESASAPDDRVANVKALYDASQWEAVLQAVPESPDNPAQLQLYRGLAFAQLQQWGDARRAFEAGLARNPRDARFLEELAGAEYKQRQFSRAKQHLRRALALDPSDNYANNFLASIYFLEGNLEAALAYWNRAAKPRLSDLSFRGTMNLDPVLLDRAFDFSQGSEWRRDQYLETRARLEGLNLCSDTRFNLEEQSDDAFQLVLDCTEHSTWGASKWQWLASLFRGLPYQEVHPEFYNLNRAALNWLSLGRWDDQKRRIDSEITAALRNDPKWQYRIHFDGRNENWNLTGTLLPGTSAPAGLNLEKASAGAELRSIVSGRWSWSAGLEYSYRRVRNLEGIPPEAAAFLTGGSAIAYRAQVERSLVRLPERRFTLDSSAIGEVGTFFERPLGRYSRIGGDLRSTWFPRARGDDYEMEGRLRAGRTFGAVPFDELFMLGFDRDNDLWMRGHPGLRDGQKGGAPLGRSYMLANWDIAKNIYSGPFVSLALGPFVDTGKISDPSGYFGSPDWLWDTGLQARIRVFGSFEFILGYGKDLRSGNNSFFTTVSR